MVAVDVVVYFRVSNATISITNVEDSSRLFFFLMHVCCRFLYLIPDHGIGPNIYPLVFGFRSTKLLAQTTLRNVLGTKTLTEMLSDREQISLQIQVKFTNSNHYFVFRLLYLGNSR